MTAAFALLLLQASLPARPTQPAARGERELHTVIINHVKVVDVEHGIALPDRSVTIRGDRIIRVGPAARAASSGSSTVIDGRGKYLIPALWDMAAWVLDARACNTSTFPLYVGHGVLGVRDLGSAHPLEEIRPLKDSLARGLLVGPRILFAGRAIGRATPPLWPSEARTPAEMERSVDSLVTAGADYIESRQYADPDLLPAVIAAASRHHLSVSGTAVFGFDRAAMMGMRNIDHPVDLYRSTSIGGTAYSAAYRVSSRAEVEARFREAFASLPASARRPGDSAYTAFDQVYAYFAYLRATRDTSAYRHAISTLVRHGTFVTTNFSDGASVTRFEVGNPQRERWRTHAQNVALYRNLGTNRRMWDYDATRIQRDGLLGDIRDLHAAGVHIMAGTQAACSGANTPGASLHDELVWLTESGFTPGEALRAATWEPARFLLATDSLGTVAPGKVADLVLLDGNPLTDIRNTQAIRFVILHGRVLSRRRLDDMLRRAESPRDPSK